MDYKQTAFEFILSVWFRTTQHTIHTILHSQFGTEFTNVHP